jgi:hypothetical protein
LQLYAKDWLGSMDIALMTAAQEGAFIHLICLAWIDADCSLPGDDTSLAVLSRLGAEWDALKDKILRCFAPHPDRPGRLIVPWLFEYRQELEARAEQQSSSGKRGADERWRGHRNAIGGLMGSPSAGDGHPTGQALARGVGSDGPSSASSSASPTSGEDNPPYTPPRSPEAEMPPNPPSADLVERMFTLTGEPSTGLSRKLYDHFASLMPPAALDAAIRGAERWKAEGGETAPRKVAAQLAREVRRAAAGLHIDLGVDLLGFDEFWAQCPRKEGKGAAEKAWRGLKLGTDDDLREKVMAGLTRILPAWNQRIVNGEADKVPHPSTWLNQRRWEDEPVMRTAATSPAVARLPGEANRQSLLAAFGKPEEVTTPCNSLLPPTSKPSRS